MIRINCEAIVRMSHLFTHANDPEFEVLRLEDGLMIATDRSWLAAEKINHSFAGTHHIIVDEHLLAQCRVESQFSGFLEIIPNEQLQFTVGKTMTGFQTGNIGRFTPTPTFDKWRTIFQQCREPLTETSGIMVWQTHELVRLASSSPSGQISFEEHHKIGARPLLVRDITTPDWCGCFNGETKDGGYHAPAALPGWLA